MASGNGAPNIGDGRCEHQARLVSPSHGADGIEEKPRPVEIDPVSLLQIGFGLARDDRGKVEDDIGAARHQLLRLSRDREVGCQCLDMHTKHQDAEVQRRHAG